MYANATFALAVTLALGGTSTGHVAPVTTVRQHVIRARVRFSNAMSPADTAGLADNGAVLFTRIAPGQRTDYVMVSDSEITFTLRGPGRDSIMAKAAISLLDQASYTVTATRNRDDRPRLDVVRDD
jgi:hypothetical protein